MRKTVITAIICVFSMNYLMAQFTVTGEFRPRFEYRHGYKTLPSPESEDAAQVSQRSRLGIGYDSEKILVFLSMQEVKMWGNKGMFDNSTGLGLHQGYIELRMTNSLSVRAGRQEIRYDNQRLFAINNWNQNGRVHDAAVLKFAQNGWNVHIGAAFNQDTDRNFGTSYSMSQYKTLNYLWANKTLGQFTLSALAVADGYQKANTTNTTYLRSTIGGIAIWKPGKASLEVHGYLQGGKNQTGKEINAWYAHLAANYAITKAIKISAGAEVLSGNDNTKTEKQYKVFVPLFSANHAYHGHLDYFTDIPNHTKNAGLVNPYLKLAYRIDDKFLLNADYHYFRLQNNAVIAVNETQSQLVDNYLGSEIDLNLQYSITKQADITIGYSTMFATEAMESIKGGSSKEPIHWAWVMLTVKPTLFTNAAK